MTGLFSLLDAMLGLRMEEVLGVLPLEENVVNGLLGEGDFYDLLLLATSFERGQWEETSHHLKKLNLEMSQTELLYIQSRGWTQQMLGFCKVC